jgi:predicted hotdog family 3-hydroxylacyl-ACP dehydratase
VYLSVVELWVGIVGACQNAVAVEIGLVTGVRDLQLLVQAQEAEARENAHADGSDEVVSVRCSSVGQKLVADENEIWRSVVEWLEKKTTRDATGLLGWGLGVLK